MTTISRVLHTCPLTGSAPYVVTAEADGVWGGHARDAKLITISNIAALARGDDKQSLLWVVEADTGRPIGAAEVDVYLEQRNKRHLLHSTRTDDAGLLRTVKTTPDKPGGSDRLLYVIRQGPHFAKCDSHWQSGGPAACPFVCTASRIDPCIDRSRPSTSNTSSALSGEGQLESQPSRLLMVRVRDPRGEVVYEARHATNEHGCTSGEWTIPTGAATGRIPDGVRVGRTEALFPPQHRSALPRRGVSQARIPGNRRAAGDQLSSPRRGHRGHKGEVLLRRSGVWSRRALRSVPGNQHTSLRFPNALFLVVG